MTFLHCNIYVSAAFAPIIPDFGYSHVVDDFCIRSSALGQDSCFPALLAFYLYFTSFSYFIAFYRFSTFTAIYVSTILAFPVSGSCEFIRTFSAYFFDIRCFSLFVCAFLVAFFARSVFYIVRLSFVFFFPGHKSQGIRLKFQGTPERFYTPVSLLLSNNSLREPFLFMALLSLLYQSIRRRL